MPSGTTLMIFPPAIPTPAVGPDASLSIYSEFCPLETHLQIRSSKALISVRPLID